MTSPLARIPWATWKPRLVDCLGDYGRRAFASDLLAGLTVGVVALPLAMAFGIASGVTPQAGIYTAIVGGFLVSLLGGSRIQIGGPTGAFVVIVAGIIAKHGLSGLLMVTMMAGVILLFLALTGLGQAVKFIPRPGGPRLHQRHRAADRLDADQGLPRAGAWPGPTSEFFARMGAIGEALPTIDPIAVGARDRDRSPSSCWCRNGSRGCRDRSSRCSRAPPRSRRSGCRSRRSDRSSAGSPAACRRSPFRTSAPT